MTLVNETLGSRWLTPHRFRFGASGLLDDIEKVVRDGVAIMEREAAEANQTNPQASEEGSVDATCKELRKKQQSEN